jgi:hypothetical protein
MLVEPITATYATRPVGSTAIPRGYGPSGIRLTSRAVRTLITLRSYEHQFETSTNRLSGVTATYFGTDPTWIARSMRSVRILMRKR